MNQSSTFCTVHKEFLVLILIMGYPNLTRPPISMYRSNGTAGPVNR